MPISTYTDGIADAIRSIGVSQGQAPFTQHRSRLGRFLVASGLMRSGYSISKIIAFLALAVAAAAAVYTRAHVRRVPAYPPGPDAVTAQGARAWIASLAESGPVGRKDLAASFAPSAATRVERIADVVLGG